MNADLAWAVVAGASGLIALVLAGYSLGKGERMGYPALLIAVGCLGGAYMHGNAWLKGKEVAMAALHQQEHQGQLCKLDADCAGALACLNGKCAEYPRTGR